MGMNQGWPHRSGIVVGSWYFLLWCGCACLNSQRTNLEPVREWQTWIPCKTDVEVSGQGAGPLLLEKRKETSNRLLSSPTYLPCPPKVLPGVSLLSGQRYNLLVSFPVSGGCADLLPWGWDKSTRLLWKTCMFVNMSSLVWVTWAKLTHNMQLSVEWALSNNTWLTNITIKRKKSHVNQDQEKNSALCLSQCFCDNILGL